MTARAKQTGKANLCRTNLCRKEIFKLGKGNTIYTEMARGL